ncbi:NAD-P-binding protein [Mycena leptocephala]|nr:NAD-P-binding protein [Mycena leptocephala]
MPARKSVSEEDLVDLHGKVVLVTGGNTGIGYATIQMLARKGAKVYMGARDEGRALEAIKQLQAENINDGSVHWLKLDLSDPRAAQRAAQEFLEKENRLDIIAAQELAWSLKLDKDGLLDIMVCNHISHFALTDALLPLMKETAKEPAPTQLQARERAPHKGAPETPHCRVRPHHMHRCAPRPVKSVGSDGFLTSIPFVGGFLKRYVGPLFFGPWRNGAMTVAFAAAGRRWDKHETYQGAYMVPIATISPASKFALDERLQEELYETTEKIISELA